MTQRQPVKETIRSKDCFWPFWPAVPLYPHSQRRTIRQEVVKGAVWTFEQLQGIFYVVVPIRMSVVKLEVGGLLAYAPVAPTPECVRLVRELEAEHGPVKYIILPTISGLEHKVFAGPFARQFPQAQVFIAPHQWSFPVNLPLSWLGFPAKRTYLFPSINTEVPFTRQFDWEMLGPIELGTGRFAEVAVFDKRSQTLLVTDTVLSIPDTPPAIVQLDPYPLLFHARDKASDRVENTEANRRKGWQRICLFALYFRASTLETLSWGRAFRESFGATERSLKAYFGLYPFAWKPSWHQSFAALQSGGPLLVAPILQMLILNRAPRDTLNWADRVASWNFRHIVPCHFSAPIEATPQQFRRSFAFLEQNAFEGEIIVSSDSPFLPAKDFALLNEIDQMLTKLGITPPPQPKV